MQEKATYDSGDENEITLYTDESLDKQILDIKNETTVVPMPPTVLESVSKFTSISNIKTELFTQWNHTKPWSDFFSRDKLSIPDDLSAARERVSQNLIFFQTNYFLLSVILSLYYILTTPTLLFCSVFTLGLSFYLLQYRKDPIVLFGSYELTMHHKMTFVFFVSFVMILLTPVASTTLFIAGFSFCLVAIHSLIWTPDSEKLFNDNSI